MNAARLPAVASSALAIAAAGAASVLYGSLFVVPHTRNAPGQIALPVAFGAPLLLAGAVVLALLVARRPESVADAFGAPLAAVASRRGLAIVLLVLVAAVAALLLASDVWAYTTLRWAIPRGLPVFVG